MNDQREMKLSTPQGSAPEVLESSARTWDDRETGAFLLDNGEWILVWMKHENGERKKTQVKLTSTAMMATMLAVTDILDKTGKPLGWEPEQNAEVSHFYPNNQKG